MLRSITKITNFNKNRTLKQGDIGRLRLKGLIECYFSQFDK